MPCAPPPSMIGLLFKSQCDPFTGGCGELSETVWGEVQAAQEGGQPGADHGVL